MPRAMGFERYFGPESSGRSKRTDSKSSTYAIFSRLPPHHASKLSPVLDKLQAGQVRDLARDGDVRPKVIFVEGPRIGRLFVDDKDSGCHRSKVGWASSDDLMYTAVGRGAQKWKSRITSFERRECHERIIHQGGSN